jgi:hypothetical protein
MQCFAITVSNSRNDYKDLYKIIIIMSENFQWHGLQSVENELLKQEWPVAAMFVYGSGRNEQSL